MKNVSIRMFEEDEQGQVQTNFKDLYVCSKTLICA